jgi:hypothetical protein
LELAKLLIESGVDKDKARSDGRTALFAACETGHLEVAKLLIQSGVDKNKATSNGCTPLFPACGHGHLGVAKLLIESGVDMDKAKSDGSTPLFVACHEGHSEVAKLLIESGVDKDKATGDGATPLLIAREQGHSEVVELLLKSGKRKKTKRKKKRKKKTHLTAATVQEERADQQEARLVAEKAGDGAAGARQELPAGSNKKKNSGHVCGRSGCGEIKPNMMICGECQLTHYCDKQCQRADWKVHKTGCRQESIARRAREERALSLLATESEEEETGEEAEETKVEEEEKEEEKEEAIEETKEEDSDEQQVEPEEGMEAVEDNADAARAAVEEEDAEQEFTQNQQEDAEAACTSGSFPNEFFCPITLELMRDPVLAKDGHTYERKAIKDWFERGTDRNAISPKTLDEIGRQLTPNHAMKALIGDEESKRSILAAPAAPAPPAAPAMSLPFLQQPPTTWSAELVADWLGNIGKAYAEYGDAFIKNGIDGEELLGVDFGKELEELGVASKMHQRRLIKEIQKLKR